MRTVRQIWKIAANNIRRMAGNARFYIALLWGGVFMQYYGEQVRLFALETQVKSSPWVLPHFLSGILLQIMIVLGSVLIFCDAPFITDQTKDYLIRTGRKKWFWGQVIYIITASFLYAFGLMVVSILLLLPEVEFSAEWGKLLNTMAQSGWGSVFKDLIQNYTPAKAMGLSLMAISMNSIFIGTVMMAVNVYVQKSIGPAVGAVIALSPYLLIRMNDGNMAYFFAPSTWLNIRIYNRYNGMRSPTIAYIYGMWMLLIAAAIVLAYIKVRRYDFNRLPEE